MPNALSICHNYLLLIANSFGHVWFVKKIDNVDLFLRKNIQHIARYLRVKELPTRRSAVRVPNSAVLIEAYSDPFDTYLVVAMGCK